MQVKRALLKFSVLLLSAVLLAFLLPENDRLIAFYSHWFYEPFQSLRGVLLGYIQLSVGDVIYVAGGAGILYTLARWVRNILNFRTQKVRHVLSLLNALNVVVFVYVFFILGWGANYYKPTLRATWQLKEYNDTLQLNEFDSILVMRLNQLSVKYKPLSLEQINTISRANYLMYTDAKVQGHGLEIKPTLFAFFMKRLSIDGYYNPFTGEGQVVKDIPGFMLPFVVSHEMAHQAGIAAEGDANLMAYALGELSHNVSFNYSADLNIWMYVNARLFRRDSMTAKKWEAQLNKLTQAHIDTLDEIRKLSDNDASKISGEMYDSYLKMQQQKDGIRSYGSVTVNAWLLEKKWQREGPKGIKLKMP